MIDRETLHSLLPEVGFPAVTILMPTHVMGRETRQDPIRLRNLLDQAQGELQAAGLRDVEAGEILSPARRLIDETPFWQHQDRGLAVLLAKGRTHILKLPSGPAEEIYLDDRFLVRPLLPAYAEGAPMFVVLALTLRDMRLFRGTRFGLQPVPVDTLPRGMATLFADEDADRGAPGGRGGGRPA